jgi:hypothetical protein
MYCATEDLLIQPDMILPVSLEKSRFIEFASSDMDAKLGYIYVTPINLSALPQNQAKLLRSICAKLASGRLIMAAAMTSQDSAVHQYALFLVRQAETDLMSIANGQVDLTAPLVDFRGSPIEGGISHPQDVDPYARVPTGWNPDRSSMVNAFEETVMDGSGGAPIWRPSEKLHIDGTVSQ